MTKHVSTIGTNTLARTRLGLLIAMTLASGGAWAQSTTGSIAGQVPAGLGDTVTIQSSTGLVREVPVDSRGRYVATQLPVGSYTVTLKRGGEAVPSTCRKPPTWRASASPPAPFRRST